MFDVLRMMYDVIRDVWWMMYDVIRDVWWMMDDGWWMMYDVWCSNCGWRWSTIISALQRLPEGTLLITNSRRMKLIAASLMVSLYPKGLSHAHISSIVWTSPFRISSFNGKLSILTSWFENHHLGYFLAKQPRSSDCYLRAIQSYSN